jgi:cysteine desulfurase
MHTVYLDHAAATAPLPEALAAQADAARRWPANPSAAHSAGRAVRAELERLRAEFQRLCGFAGGRLVLTSGATEANNWVVRGRLDRDRDGRILISPDVHASLWNACCREPGRMDVLPLDPGGRLCLADIASRIGPATGLVCVPHAANETGVIHDIAAISALCERRGISCHIDGTQALGHIPVDLASLSCGSYAFGAHKFGGPRGCGGLFVREAPPPALLAGGLQEGGLRAGTENLPALAGTVAALSSLVPHLAAQAGTLRALAGTTLGVLRAASCPFEVNGDPDTGLPGLLSLSFPGLNGHALAADLSIQGFAVATGSACSEDRPEPSRAIVALGRPPATALGTIRISFGPGNTPSDAAAVAAALLSAVHRHQPRETR